ncbi:glycosyltransferase family 2 protein [Silvibacterium sp.]|uniref:glycosyltransferase family 2 protein n=1 Tax=Silvibacterium sp. TaxID=1964179 RepID=UPI0039E3AFBF
MASSPSISVVLCTYNGQQFLPQQLDSITGQTILPNELIVCDDGSTDSTLEQLAKFASEAPFTVRIHRNDRRLGSTRNFDQGLALAQGQLIALCDQDDVWEPEKLERLCHVMEDETIGGIFTDATLIDDSGRTLPENLWLRAGFTPARRAKFDRDPVGLLLRQDVATGATMMIRGRLRRMYQDIPEEWVHDGWLAWMLVLYQSEAGRLQAIENRLTRYRIHSSQQTGSSAVALGLPSESVGKRLTKARQAGHEHHRRIAQRFRLVREHWLSRGGSADAPVARRLLGAIRLLESRSMLPVARWRRLPAVLWLLPAYIRYAGGWRSAGRDLWA